MHSSHKKRKLTDAPLGERVPILHTVFGMLMGTDSVETLSASKKCTCDSGGVKDPKMVL